METINQQLNIMPTPRNTTMVSRYARGANTYQVQLGNEDPSLDFYNDVQSIGGYHNANGWDAVPEVESSDYNYFLGVGYPLCVNLRCKNCKNDCKNVKGLKWGQGGKECHKSCILDTKNEQMDRIETLSNPNSSVPANNDATNNNKASEQTKKGLGTGAIVGIGIGVLVLVVGTILILKKKKQ